MTQISIGKLITEGKTKRIFEANGVAGRVVVESKDDLTAGNGVRHDVVAGKALFSNRTTSNVFRLLKAHGLPVAFVEEVDATHFLSEQCVMIPYEVVVRREAHGSALKRHPEFSRGYVFQNLLLEFYLKTSGKRWKDIDLPVDDPLVHFEEDCISLYLPDKPIAQQSPFLTLIDFPLKESVNDREEIGKIAMKTFLILEKAWQSVGRRLVDFKIEFGINVDGKLRLADVIDNDSWRVLDDGQYIDKQLYRDGADLKIVFEKYKMVAELTNNFTKLIYENTRSV